MMPWQQPGVGPARDQALHNEGEADVPKRASTKRASGDRGTDENSNLQMANNKSPRAGLTSSATKSGKTTLSSEDEDEDNCKDGPSLNGGTSAFGEGGTLSKLGEDEEDDCRKRKD